MDDTLFKLRKENVKPTFEMANGWPNNLVFTMDGEDSNITLNFLDIKIIRIDHRMETTWFSKPSNNGVTLKFYH